LGYESGGVDKKNVELGLNLERRKRPTRFRLDFEYAFETTEPPGQAKETTEDEFRAFLLGEYDLDRRFFLFALPAAERDKPRGIKIRTFPSAGIGYRFAESEKGLLQFQLGLAYVHENFVDFDNNDYMALHIGLEGRYRFGRGIVLAGRTMYLPSFDGPVDDWLWRTELSLTVPLFDPLSLKFKITEVNDDNPTEDVGNNKLETSLLLLAGS